MQGGSGNTLLTARIDLRREAVRRVRRTRPFAIDAWVVLPDHFHAVWTLPPNDDDFSTRWRLIKTFFARGLPKTERRSCVRRADGERGKPHTVALVACARKLLVFANAVVSRGTPWTNRPAAA